jgi:hypothetical protein
MTDEIERAAQALTDLTAELMADRGFTGDMLGEPDMAMARRYARRMLEAVRNDWQPLTADAPRGVWLRVRLAPARQAIMFINDNVAARVAEFGSLDGWLYTMSVNALLSEWIEWHPGCVFKLLDDAP